MVDVHERAAVPDVLRGVSQSVEGGAVGGDDDVEAVSGGGAADAAFGVEELELGRDGVLVPDGYVLARALQGQRQAKLRPDAIAIRPDMPDDTDGVGGPEEAEDLLGGLGRILGRRGHRGRAAVLGRGRGRRRDVLGPDFV